MSNRFKVALSFPGEHRDFVLAVAQSLADKLLKEKVFYDEWYEVELLGAGGDLKLLEMYEQADLVVPFFSEHYDKPWCSLEWETVRGILLNRRDAVVPVHLDDTKIPGWSVVNFGINLKGRTPKEIAEIILKVLAKRNHRSGRSTPQEYCSSTASLTSTEHSSPTPSKGWRPSTAGKANYARIGPISFVGRGQEKDEVIKYLVEGSSVLIGGGVGGLGKTALAAEVCREMFDSLNDGVFWVEVTSRENEQWVNSLLRQVSPDHAQEEPQGFVLR